MIGVLAERVSSAQVAGETAAEMIAHEITADYDERWGGFSFVPQAKFVETLATDLAQESK